MGTVLSDRVAAVTKTEESLCLLGAHIAPATHIRFQPLHTPRPRQGCSLFYSSVTSPPGGSASNAHLSLIGMGWVPPRVITQMITIQLHIYICLPYQAVRVLRGGAVPQGLILDAPATRLHSLTPTQD